MLQSFINFPKFTEFTEFPPHLGKPPVAKLLLVILYFFEWDRQVLRRTS